MRLSDRQRQLLAYLEHRAAEPISKAAKVLGYRHHNLRYQISKLRDAGVIVGEALFLNLYPLGYTDYTLFFSASSTKPGQREELIQMLSRSGLVFWIAEMIGTYEYAVSFLAKNLNDLHQFLRNEPVLQKSLVLHRALSLRLRLTAFGRRYLSQKSFPLRTFQYGTSAQIVSIDDHESRILEALLTSRFESFRGLAEKVAQPLSTVLRKVKNLQENGVIEGHLYRYNIAELSVLNYRLLIFSRGLTTSFREKLYKYCLEEPRVTHFIECLGQWDYEISLEVENTTQLTQIIRTLYDRFGMDIERIEELQISRVLTFSGFRLKST